MNVDETTQKMLDNLPKTTGKSLAEWLEILQAAGLTKHGEMVNFLKTDYGIGHGFANLIAHKFRGSDAGSAEDKGDLVAQQYAGKENLRPIYDALVDAIGAFGSDVEFSPKNANVSVRRKKQFALIQPPLKPEWISD